MTNLNTSSIGDYIDAVIKASLRKKGILSERRMKPNVKQNPETANISGQAKSESNKEDERILKRGDVELIDIINKLNAIRAGRSVRDESIQHELDVYYENLSLEERIALFAYLKGLAEIVSGAYSGENASEPADVPASIKMLRKRSQKNIKSDIVVKGRKTSKKSDKEDTTPPTPIEPKTR